MSVLEQLNKNKGTLSSALGKTLARQVLGADRTGILTECIDLALYQAPDPRVRHIRAGAAKVVEIVAEERPGLVAPHLEELLPALSVPEPQTRWMVIRTMGFCARANTAAAKKAIPSAEKMIREKNGLCLTSSADLFLGDFGAVSKECARKAFPLLERSMQKPIPNEPDWLLEACYKLYFNLGKTEQQKVLRFAGRYRNASRKSTRQRVKLLLELGNPRSLPRRAQRAGRGNPNKA
jgi:hypothetical protein